MRAIKISKAGDADVLQLVDVEKPVPDEHQVLIKVAAAGINRPDIMQRQGLYPPPPGASEIPGLEVAGVIVETGKNVKQWRPGDKVCALLTGGGYAEYCLASEMLCLPIPAGLDFIQAAAIPETFFTVWSNVFDRGQIKPGETILVHGGSSGIGTAAIQLCTAFDATVFVTAGSDEKCDFCVNLGAEAAINYKKQDFVDEVMRLTHHKGVDLVLDMVAGDYFPKNIKCLADDGRLVQIAIQHGAKSEINLWKIMSKRLTVTGSTLRSRNDEFKAGVARKLQKKVWPLFESGKIKLVIEQTFPLDEVQNAQQLMEKGDHKGKIVLLVE